MEVSWKKKIKSVIPELLVSREKKIMCIQGIHAWLWVLGSISLMYMQAILLQL